jgi:hypothetical protein
VKVGNVYALQRLRLTAGITYDPELHDSSRLNHDKTFPEFAARWATHDAASWMFPNVTDLTGSMPHT